MTTPNRPDIPLAESVSRRAWIVAIIVLAINIWPGRFTLGQPADLVLRQGKIVTLQEDAPPCSAVAVRGDRIVFVGTDSEVQRLINDRTKVIDADGRLVVPGFIEGHGHFVGLGRSKMVLDLTQAKTWEEIVELVARAAQQLPRGQWIRGRGWHQSKWATAPQPSINGYPLHQKLSRRTPNHPVLLTHASGHMSFANAAAMRASRVSSATPDPRGGQILRDERGDPIGVFRETAQGLIRSADGDASSYDIDRAIELATGECLAKGVTSFQDAGSSLPTISVLRQLAEQQKLKVRLWVMVRDGNDRLARSLADHRMIGIGRNHLTVRAIKRSIDGALGAHGAWLLEPYEDLPTSSGLNTSSIESVRRTADLAVKHNFQLCVHAIGDRANRQVLDIFEDTFRRHPAEASRRWRIEHAQHLHPDDIGRFAGLGVIASMQGVHCTSDAVFVFRRLGQRRAASGAYVWQSLLKSGAVVTNGTDAPVEDVDPLRSFYASVTRKLEDGVEFFPQQKMSREQALRSYTIDAAYAAFEEDLKGSIEPGKLADLVVLSHDIMTCSEAELRSAKVDLTIVGGKVLYERR